MSIPNGRVPDPVVCGTATGWTVRAAADSLGLSERAIRRAISRGDLPAVKVVGTYQIWPSDLEDYRGQLVERGGQRRPVATLHLMPVPSLILPPLPVPFTSFVGREDLVATLADVLVRPELGS